MTISATMPIRISSPQLMSNMSFSARRRYTLRRLFPDGLEGRTLGLPLCLGAICETRLLVDGLQLVALGGLGLGDFVVRHALLERLDALRHVAHELGNL